MRGKSLSFRLIATAGLTYTSCVASADLAKGLAAVEQRDWSRALAEFRPLAELGDPDAEVNLGNLYMRGYGVPQDYAAALAWYRKAAGLGNVKAKAKLGLMYFHGLGLKENLSEAILWFRAAAEQRDASAAVVLGTLYSAGGPTARDPVEAYYWYSLAADWGHRDAVELRNRLADEMTPGEIGEGLDRVVSWRVKNEPGSPATVPPAQSEPKKARGR